MDNIQDGDFQFMIKAVLLSFAMLAELWLVSDFVNNFVMVFMVTALLWAVCGGHASLCAVDMHHCVQSIVHHQLP